MLAKRRYCTCSKMTDWDSMCQLYIQVSLCYTPAVQTVRAVCLWHLETNPLLDFFIFAHDYFLFCCSSLWRADNCWHDFHHLRPWRPRTRWVCERRCRGKAPVNTRSSRTWWWLNISNVSVCFCAASLKPAECGKTTSPPSMASSSLWIVQTGRDCPNQKQNLTWVLA